ncbi:MAG: dual specificity protein phosphatase family protein [Caldilineaceae bacterium]|nr:dual specificity protein phosphatase family protein [Caldilineaceae bacterium]
MDRTTGHCPAPPGRRLAGSRGRAWKEAGIEAVVSLLVSTEEWELGLQQEAEVSQSAGIRFFAFPIPDRQTPRSAEKMRDLIGQLSALLSKGQTVAIHCRQSVGRSALLAAALLVEAGVSSDDAFERIARARGCPVPDTPEQRRWVEQLVRTESNGQHWRNLRIESPNRGTDERGKIAGTNYSEPQSDGWKTGHPRDSPNC